MHKRRDASGLNKTTKSIKLPGGESVKVTYFYHRKSGIPIGNTRAGMTEGQAREVVRLWEAEPDCSGPMAGTVNSLCALYKASSHFEGLAEKTRHEYQLEITRIETALGSRLVDSITKSDITAMRDARRHVPYAANATIRTFSALLSWGVRELDYITHNPARDVAQLPTQPRDAVWLEDQRSIFMEVAGPHLRRAMATLRFAVQRTRDTLKLRRSAIYEHGGRAWINLRQSKTSALVAIPLHAELLRVYEENPVEGDYLCPSPDGTLWTYDSFANAWDHAVARANIRLARRLLRLNPLPSRRRAKAREEAKLEVRKRLIVGLQRRDLRRTGMVELALCGVPDTQIAALSGHTIETTRRILDTYIPRRAELALAAIEKWETSDGTNVIGLHTMPVQQSLEAAIERAMNKSANRTANRTGIANPKKAVSP